MARGSWTGTDGRYQIARRSAEGTHVYPVAQGRGDIMIMRGDIMIRMGVDHIHEQHYRDGNAFHREDGPAQIRWDRATMRLQSETYYLDDVISRQDDGPAQITYHNDWSVHKEMFYRAGVIHRDHNPAMYVWFPDRVLNALGFYRHGLPHRDDGPAVLEWYPDETLKREQYFRDGIATRDDGPAATVYYPSGRPSVTAYYRDGVLSREGAPALILWHASGSFKKKVYYRDGVAGRTLIYGREGAEDEGRLVMVRNRPDGPALDMQQQRHQHARRFLGAMNVVRALDEKPMGPSSIWHAQKSGSKVRAGHYDVVFRDPRRACGVSREHHEDPRGCDDLADLSRWENPVEACIDSHFSDYQLRGYLAGLEGLPGADDVDPASRYRLCRRIADWEMPALEVSDQRTPP